MKEELLRLLAGVGPEAQKLEPVGQEIVQFVRFAREVAGPLTDLVAEVLANQLSSEEWARQAETWRGWHDHDLEHLVKLEPPAGPSSTQRSFGSAGEAMNHGIHTFCNLVYWNPGYFDRHSCR
jgi:hypothetical protein